MNRRGQQPVSPVVFEGALAQPADEFDRAPRAVGVPIDDRLQPQNSVAVAFVGDGDPACGPNDFSFSVAFTGQPAKRTSHADELGMHRGSEVDLSARIAPVARVEKTFTMQVPPDKAEEMFVRDLAPDLAKDRGFHITHEKPGHLVFSDVPVESPGGFDTRHGASVEEIDLLARHIRVEFTPEGTGTLVKLHGHAEKDIRDAIDKLGTPDHWPEIADRPHD